jgi:hypothetical protein
MENVIGKDSALDAGGDDGQLYDEHHFHKAQVGRIGSCKSDVKKIEQCADACFSE